MLTSLGGGGFLLARPAGRPPVLFDFFVQTPHRRRPEEELDFYPILADFGTARQEFHIGLGAMAVPGMVAGLFEAREALGSLPMSEIVAPAVELARRGVRVTAYQSWISRILEPILRASPEATALAASVERPDEIAGEGDLVRHPDMADVLEELAAQGPGLFYRGDLARRLARDCERGGGQLTLEDLAAYQVRVREPVIAYSHGARFAFNAPPSPGGGLVAFALALLDPLDFEADEWGTARHCLALARAMRSAQRLRDRLGPGQRADEMLASRLREGRELGGRSLEEWRQLTLPGPMFSRGTTHISVADRDGNLASLTTSNGEGCSYVIPGTGIMMNNMLGEEDLNPGGFHCWPRGQRLASMMCPSVATLADGTRVALGTGGANRIRSAVLQVLLNLFAFRMPLERAVAAPRMHLEGDRLSLEAGFRDDALTALRDDWPELELWPEPNLFFGGVHAVELLPDGSFRGAGDPRRDGAVARNP
jgi:gamma-glutamyltranspeptidase/glutathione hydrolase